MLGYIISHSSWNWEAKFDPGLNKNVCLTMFAKGASSDSPVSVEHSVKLQIFKPIPHHFPRGVSFTYLNHLASSGSHFLKRVKGLTLIGMILHENSYELFSSPHLRLHSLGLFQTLHPRIVFISLLCEQNTLRNLAIAWKIRSFSAEEYKALCS